MTEHTLEKTSKSVSSSTSNSAKIEKTSNSVASTTSNLADTMALPSTGKRKRNKYAFVCSLLSSMTSILLGYGEFFGSSYLNSKKEEEKLGSFSFLVSG